MARTPFLPRLNRIGFFLRTNGDLASALSHAIAEHAEHNPERPPTERQAAVSAWGRMRIDVPNGGFTQFFYNHRDDGGVAALATLLDSLELPKAATVVRDALALYREHRDEFNVANPWDGLFGSIKGFDKLDRAFGRALSRSCKVIEQWIRSHITELATDEGGEPIDARFTGSIESRGTGGVLRESLEVKNGKPHGAYRDFFEDGSLRNVVFYKSGKVTGDFWPNGQLKRKESKRGLLTVIEWFYPSGQLQKRYVKEKSGYPAEPVRVYHENGRLAEELTVAGSKLRGPWLKFFDDGSPLLEAEHIDDEQLVVHNAWDDGRKQIVRNGTGIFRSDGRMINWEYDLYFELNWQDETEFKRGARHGKRTTYHDGVLWSVSHYNNGVLNGDLTAYWDNGRVRSVTRFSRGTAGRATSFPKFDQPEPAVVLRVEANDKLYTAWRHIPVDEYPRALNLDEVQSRLVVPGFLREVYARNLGNALKCEYEGWNTFDDGIAYFLTVAETGEVTSAFANGSGVYSGGEWDTYLPLLKALRFAPGRIRGRAVECQVLARVDHTFVEGKPHEKGEPLTDSGRAR